MDGGKIEDVEAEVADIGKPRNDVIKGAVAPGNGGLRAREHLVPGSEGRPVALHDDFQFATIAGLAIAGCGLLEQIGGNLGGLDLQPFGIACREQPQAQVRARPPGFPGLLWCR